MRKTIIFLAIALLGIALPSQALEEGWKEHRARHFYIYYKDAPKDFVQTVADTAEEYYDEITKNLGFTRYKGWSFDDRATIYIYSDKDDYVKSSQQAKWSYGAANAKMKIIRTFPSAHGFFDSTLPHELGHIIFREFIGFHALIPLWLDEGVAMFQEKARRWGANKVVKEAIEEGKFMPVSELSRKHLYRDTEKEVVELYYAEAASVVSYMISELGQQRFVYFCRKLKDGMPFEAAFLSIYKRFRTMDHFNKGWKDYLKK